MSFSFRRLYERVSDRLWPSSMQLYTESRTNRRAAALAATSDLQFRLWAATGRYADPKSLSRFDVSMYSQNGEDGIVAEMFRRIGTRDRVFVEIGIDGGTECITRLLLEQGWSGLWLVGSPDVAAAVNRLFDRQIAEGRLRVIQGYVTPENVTALLEQGGIADRFDMLSLDIDQHTTHVWRAMRQRARVACIEYNASLPPSTACEVPYDIANVWDDTSWYGASLKTVEQIGRAHGMSLVGCDIRGINAFLVDSAEDGLFLGPFTAEFHYEPPRYPIVTPSPGHPRSDAARGWVVPPG